LKHLIKVKCLLGLNTGGNDLLDTATEVEINREIATIEKQKGKTIYVVTVPEVTVAKAKAEFKIVPPISSSRRFLESLLLNWNLEQLNQDNAMLMLVSKADHSIEIRSGSNLKYIIRDRHIQGLIDKIIIPQFKHYDFSQGILLGITELVRKISNPQYDWLPNKMKVTWESKQQERCVSSKLVITVVVANGN